jgi:hypothetical protein
MRIDIPEAIQDDLKEYLKAIAEDKTINLKDLGISQFGITDIVKSIEQIYGLSN